MSMNKQVLTLNDIKKYQKDNVNVSVTKLARIIVADKGLCQYRSFNSMLKCIFKKLDKIKIEEELLYDLDTEETIVSVRTEVKRMFFDIETSPNIGIFWRAGYKQNIFPESIINERAIICICWKWQGEDEVHSLNWDDDQCDKEMLKQFAKEILKADEVVGHNGDRFDVKWFNTRCLFHGINILPRYKTLDTLKKAKSHFYFNSNKLDYIAKYLGVGGKVSTGGLDLWKDILFKKCEEAMDKMVNYCNNDVIILEKVYLKMNSYIVGNTNHAVQVDGHKWDCPECKSGNVSHVKKTTTLAGTIHRWMECGVCDKNYKINNKTYMGFKDFQTENMPKK